MSRKATMRAVGCRAALSAIVPVLLATSTELSAEPLPKEACDLLGEEHGRLQAGGVREWMAGGAAQGRARLSPAQLEQIRRYIEVDEQLSFRCGLFRSRFSLARDVEDPPEAEKGKDKADSKPAEAPKARARPKPQPAAADSDAAEAKPAPRRRQPKQDDAYRPPVTPDQAAGRQ
jgi:hypothetical protein